MLCSSSPKQLLALFSPSFPRTKNSSCRLHYIRLQRQPIARRLTMLVSRSLRFVYVRSSSRSYVRDPASVGTAFHFNRLLVPFSCLRSLSPAFDFPNYDRIHSKDGWDRGEKTWRERDWDRARSESFDSSRHYRWTTGPGQIWSLTHKSCPACYASWIRYQERIYIHWSQNPLVHMYKLSATLPVS